jgi:hypothetical protein
MSKRVKAQRCVIDNDGGVYGFVDELETPERFDTMFSTDAPHVPSIAITLADCEDPPAAWLELMAFALYLSQPDPVDPFGGTVRAHYLTVAGDGARVFLAAARAEAGGGL